jgi:Spy/CpxP family protein refolding chaperone
MIRLHMQITSVSRALLTALVAGALVSVYADPVNQTPAPKTDVQSNTSPEPSPAAASSFPKKRSVSPDSLKKRELTMLRKSVTLTPDEETKVTPIISNYVDAVQAVKADANTTTAEKRAKRKELHDQYTSNVKAVLTPDQAKTWETANAERIARLRAKKSSRAPAESASEQ